MILMRVIHRSLPMETLNYVWKDLSEPITYIPYGMVFSTVIMLVVLVGGSQGDRTVKNEKDWKEIGRFLLCWMFLVYMAVVLIQTIFSREPGSRHTMDLQLFGTLGRSARSKSYYIENIIMLVPFGIFLPLLNRKFQNMATTVLCGCLFSILIEWLQYMTESGFCQLDDVVANTLGTAIGWMVCKLWMRVSFIGFD